MSITGHTSSTQPAGPLGMGHCPWPGEAHSLKGGPESRGLGVPTGMSLEGTTWSWDLRPGQAAERWRGWAVLCSSLKNNYILLMHSFTALGVPWTCWGTSVMSRVMKQSSSPVSGSVRSHFRVAHVQWLTKGAGRTKTCFRCPPRKPELCLGLYPSSPFSLLLGFMPQTVFHKHPTQRIMLELAGKIAKIKAPILIVFGLVISYYKILQTLKQTQFPSSHSM